jgi:pectin methylesterase-like acyl-CoA thioesterase
MNKRVHCLFRVIVVLAAGVSLVACAAGRADLAYQTALEAKTAAAEAKAMAQEAKTMAAESRDISVRAEQKADQALKADGAR